MSDLPDRLGERFALGPMIGRGTCSQVYRARDLLLDREAAVKIFPVADHPRVQREVSLLASLDHPSLVGVYDVGQVDGRAFVVMALFEGGSLADRLGRTGPLPLGEAILGVSAVADALAHVHRAGVLHRDVTPRNVLFDADGRAHLSDFGVAFVADAPRITDTGIVVGSAPYLAPEQVLGEEVGPPADVYSLGLVMIEALSGRPPYTGTPLEAAVARLEQAPEIPPGLGDDVETLLTEMTATSPADRPDADAVCRRLRQAALAREVAPPRPRGTPAAREFEPSRVPTRVLMVAGAAAMSVLLAGTVVVASTWTVRDVSASANPPASLSPSASFPAQVPAAPVAAPQGSSGSDSDGWTWWRSVAGSSPRSQSTRTVSARSAEPVTAGNQARSRPRLAPQSSEARGVAASAPTERPERPSEGTDQSGLPDLTGSSDGSQSVPVPDPSDLPGLGNLGNLGDLGDLGKLPLPTTGLLHPDPDSTSTDTTSTDSTSTRDTSSTRSTPTETSTRSTDTTTTRRTKDTELAQPLGRLISSPSRSAQTERSATPEATSKNAGSKDTGTTSKSVSPKGLGTDASTGTDGSNSADAATTTKAKAPTSGVSDTLSGVADALGG